jgi:hypothetical protein
MKTSLSTALRLLREADPARGLPPFTPSDQYAHPQALVDIGERPAVAAPTRTRRRSAWLPITAAAASVLAVAGLTTWLLQPPARGRSADIVSGCAASTPAVGRNGIPVAQPSFGPTGTVGCSDDPHFAETLALVEHTLSTVPAPPDGTRTPLAPTPGLGAPELVRGDGNLIDRAAFWTAPGSPAETIAYYKAHPPTGMTITVSGDASDRRTQHQYVVFAPPDASANGIWVQFTVEAAGTGVGLRVDVSAIWVPTKPPSAYLGPVDSVDVTVTRPGFIPNQKSWGAPTVRRTLSGATAQALSAAVDALPMATNATRYCPADHGFVDDLVFHATTRTIHVVGEASGCFGVTVTIDGGPPVWLDGSIDKAVLAALGLPATYGWPG